MGPAAAIFLGGSALAAVVTGISTLWSDGAVLDPRTWAVVVAWSVPTVWSVVLPAAGAAAAVGALARWRREGAWLGFRLTGRSGRHLAVICLVIGLVTSALTAANTLIVEPFARRQTAAALEVAGAHVALWPGEVVELGGFAVRAETVSTEWWEDLFFTTDDAIGTARRGRVVRSGDRLALELHDGVASGRGEAAWRVEWGTWTRPLPERLSSRRIELFERTNADLAAAARRTEAAGRDASYEWAVLHKRWTHPLGVALLPLLWLPLGAQRRPWLWLGGVSIAYLAVVRTGDTVAPWLGGLGAAAAGPVFAVVFGVGLWLAWRDR